MPFTQRNTNNSSLNVAAFINFQLIEGLQSPEHGGIHSECSAYLHVSGNQSSLEKQPYSLFSHNIKNHLLNMVQVPLVRLTQLWHTEAETSGAVLWCLALGHWQGLVGWSVWTPWIGLVPAKPTGVEREAVKDRQPLFMLTIDIFGLGKGCVGILVSKAFILILFTSSLVSTNQNILV